MSDFGRPGQESRQVLHLCLALDSQLRRWRALDGGERGEARLQLLRFVVGRELDCGHVDGVEDKIGCLGSWPSVRAEEGVDWSRSGVSLSRHYVRHHVDG